MALAEQEAILPCSSANVFQKTCPSPVLHKSWLRNRADFRLNPPLDHRSMTYHSYSDLR